MGIYGAARGDYLVHIKRREVSRNEQLALARFRIGSPKIWCLGILNILS